MVSTFERGKFAEDIAIEHLLLHGLKFLQRNFYTPFGEIDIVMFDEQAQITVFVEVKSRNDSEDPIINISQTKAVRVFRSIEYFLASSPQINNYRFDFIGINLKQTTYDACWIKDLEVELE